MKNNIKIRLTSIILLAAIILNLIALPKKSKALGLSGTMGLFISCMVSVVGYAVFTDKEAIHNNNIKLYNYMLDKGHKAGDLAKTAQAYVLLKLTNELTIPVSTFNNKIKSVANTIKEYYAENEDTIKAEIEKGWLRVDNYYGKTYSVKATPISNFTGYSALARAYNSKTDGKYICPTTGRTLKVEYNNRYNTVSLEDGYYQSIPTPTSPSQNGYKLDYKIDKLAVDLSDKNHWYYNVSFTCYAYMNGVNHRSDYSLNQAFKYGNLDYVKESSSFLLGNAGYYLDYIKHNIPIKEYYEKKGITIGLHLHNFKYSLTPTNKPFETDITTPKKDLVLPKLPETVTNTNVSDLEKLTTELYNNNKYLDDLLNQNNTTALPNALLKDEVIIVNPNLAEVAEAERLDGLTVTEQGLNTQELLEYITNNPVIANSISNQVSKAITADIAGLKAENENIMVALTGLNTIALTNQSALTQVRAETGAIASSMDILKDFIKPKEKIKLNLDYFKNLKLPDKFPFSLPFDFVRIVKTMETNKKAPKFTINIKTYKKEIDFQEFDYYAQICRSFLYVIFLVSLTFNTKKLLGDR